MVHRCKINEAMGNHGIDVCVVKPASPSFHVKQSWHLATANSLFIDTKTDIFLYCYNLMKNIDAMKHINNVARNSQIVT